MITTVQCSICNKLINKPRVVVTDFRLHHTCSIIILVGCKHRASEGVFYIGGRRLVKLKLYSLFKSGRTKHTIEIPLNSPTSFASLAIMASFTKWCYLKLILQPMAHSAQA